MRVVPVFFIRFFLILILLVGKSFGGSVPISISKEIFLATGESFIPTSLNLLSDNDLIVTASSSGANAGLAIKINQSGEIRWAYRWRLDPVEHPMVTPIISGALGFPGGNVFLCGNQAIPRVSSERSEIGVNGVLIELNIRGELIRENILAPSEEFDVNFRGVTNCGQWGSGAYIVGYGSRIFPYAGDASVPHKNKTERFFWVVRIDPNGNVLWEKVIPTSLYIGPKLPSPQILSNGDLLVIGGGGDLRAPDGTSTDLIVLSPEGGVKAQRNIAGSYVSVKRDNPNQGLILFPWLFRPGSPSETLILDNSLNTIGQYVSDKFRGVFAYQTGKSKLVKFGFSSVMGSSCRGVATVDLITGNVDEFAFPGRGEDRYEIAEVAMLERDKKFAFTTYRVGEEIPGKRAIGITIFDLLK